MKLFTTIGLTPSLRLTVTVKLPVYVREGDNVNIDPDRFIKISYVAVKVTVSPSGSEYVGKVYVVDAPAPIVKLVNVALNKGGEFTPTITLNMKLYIGHIPSSK